MTKPSQAKRTLALSAAERKARQHDAEIGVKVVATLTAWNDNLIAPLEKRVAQLERERAVWRRLLSWLSRRRDAEAAE